MTAKVEVEVVDEGTKLKLPDAEIVGQAFTDGWLKVEALSARELNQATKLADGEDISLADAEVIILAAKKKALFLSDDTALFMIAEMYGLTVWNTWILLLEALSRNLIAIIDLEKAIDELGKKKFKLNAKRAAEILQAAKRIRNEPQNEKLTHKHTLRDGSTNIQNQDHH